MPFPLHVAANQHRPIDLEPPSHTIYPAVARNEAWTPFKTSALFELTGTCPSA